MTTTAPQESPVKPAPRTFSRSAAYFIISLLILGGVLFMAYQNGGWKGTTQISPRVPTVALPTQDPNLRMAVVSAAGNTQFAQTEQVNLSVVASSSGRDIVGYDALINYDPSFFTLVSVKSADNRFQAVPFKKEGMASVTATKIPSYNGQIILQDTNLLNITLQPRKKGTTTVSIQAAAGPEKTKMVDTGSKLLVPQLTPVTLAIY